MCDKWSKKYISNDDGLLHFQKFLKDNGILNLSTLVVFENHEKYISSQNEQIKIYKYNYKEEINKVKKIKRTIKKKCWKNRIKS